MNKLTLLFGGILILCVCIVLAGCASKPVDELKMVRTAMEEARNTDASEYAPFDWDRAQMNVQEANALIQMGRYTEAREVLVLAVGNLHTARDTATRRVESLKIEIAALQTSTGDELKKLEQTAAGAKVSPALRKRIDGALPLIQEKIAAMNAAFEDKEYLRARSAGKEAISWMQKLQKDAGSKG